MDMETLLTDLFSRNRGKIKPGFERIKALCHGLDLHLTTPAILVAGTNGKGSVANYLHQILRSHGIYSALYTSPHLLEYHERFKVDNGYIPADELINRATHILDLCQKKKIEATFFEISTALALWYFEDCGVDIMIMEVGMGGRLDATNILWPICSVITTIGLDHTEYLGNTRLKIAQEKAGIIKHHTPIFTGKIGPSERGVIRKIAQERSASLTELSQDYEYGRSKRNIFWFCRDDFAGRFSFARPLAIFDVQNMALALRVAISLQEFGLLQLTRGNIQKGLAQPLPGRFQLAKINDQTFLFDCAHNLEGLQALVASLKPYKRAPLFLLSCMKDKPIKQMVDFLKQSNITVMGFLTQSPRCMQLSDLMAAQIDMPLYESYEKAVVVAQSQVQANQLIVVAGSCYATGEVLKKGLG